MKIELFKYIVFKPHQYIAFNLDTIVFTWIAMSIFFAAIYFGKRFLNKPENVVSFIMESSVSTFYNLCVETFGYFNYNYFAFATSLFFFTLMCNIVALLPYIEEPTKDLHTAAALGILSFFYVQCQKIKVHGLRGFLKEFIEPIFIMLPLNIIGELAKVLSMSFRLFGNILGGAIVMLIALQALDPYKKYFISYALVMLVVYLILRKFRNYSFYPTADRILYLTLMLLFLLSLVQMFFVIFEGFIQAFVITMLTLTYLAVGTAHEQEIEFEEEGEV